MGDRALQRAADFRQQLAERGGGRDPCPQHDRVQEISEHRLEFGPAATGRRRTNQHVRLARVAVQQHLERGQHRGEQRRTLAVGKFDQPPRQVVRKLEMKRVAAKRLGPRARAIGGQIQIGQRTLQLVAPVLPQAIAVGTGEDVGLPVDEVGVLHFGGRQFRGSAGDFLSIEGHQFVEQQIERPEIDGNVMRGDQQHLRPLASKQEHPDHGPCFEVEGAVGFRLQFRLQSGVVPLAGIDLGELKLVVRGDHLHRQTVLRPVGGSQDGMAIDDFLKRSGEGIAIDILPDPGRIHDVVGGTLLIELMDEPQCALAVGQRARRLFFSCLGFQQLRE